MLNDKQSKDKAIGICIDMLQKMHEDQIQPEPPKIAIRESDYGLLKSIIEDAKR